MLLNLREARVLIADWRQHYNRKRPHSRLGYLSPEDFKKQNNQILNRPIIRSRSQYYRSIPTIDSTPIAGWHSVMQAICTSTDPPQPQVFYV